MGSMPHYGQYKREAKRMSFRKHQTIEILFSMIESNIEFL